MDGILNHPKSGKFMEFLRFSLQPLYEVWYIGLLFPQWNEFFMKNGIPAWSNESNHYSQSPDFDDCVFQCFGVFSCTNLASKSP